MREQLTTLGVRELLAAQEVQEHLGTGLQLVLVNSVCGCAAANARPAMKVLAQEELAVELLTVFAGVHREATAALREQVDETPSSPSFALFKEGACVYFLPRAEVEGASAQAVASKLRAAIKEYAE